MIIFQTIVVDNGKKKSKLDTVLNIHLYLGKTYGNTPRMYTLPKIYNI